MKNGWYILNYHDISWEENILVRGIGGTLPPDIFRDHLERLNKYFKLVSVQRGWELFSQNKITEPTVSFWFDDGLSGVRKYAYPLLERYSVKGAMSINSRFILRKEFFWRFKLSLLNHSDGMRFLRSRLGQSAHGHDLEIKDLLLTDFSDETVAIIDSLYNERTNEAFRHDAYRIFDTIDGIKELLNNGWVIANHSASHYPMGKGANINRLSEQFLECEKDINRNLDIRTRFWVIPFGAEKSKTLMDAFYKADDDNRDLVFVGNKINKSYGGQDRSLYRISAPLCKCEKLIRFLERIPIAVC